MSTFQTLHKIAFCNPNKSSDLISCSESVFQVLNEASVGQSAALERLFYLLMSCEVMEQKIKRETLPSRDPVKLDLEHNIKKCIDCIFFKMTHGMYNIEMMIIILKWCFKALTEVKESGKLLTTINKMLLSASSSLYDHDEESYVDTMFNLFSSECSDVTNSTVLVKVLNPYPKLTSNIVKMSYDAYASKTDSFGIYKSVLLELSKYNCTTISTAVMDLLEEEYSINQKIGFVLNVLCSIPNLQPMSIMLLNESQAFKHLMNNSKDVLSNTMIDDLAKLFMHSHVNSYNTVMSLLEQDSEASSLGPSLLQRILLNLELAVYGVIESKDKKIMFIENMSSTEDIRMFCKCLSFQKPSKHPYILKCLSIICIYKDHCVAKTVISELMLTQPLDRYEVLLDIVMGVYPKIHIECFKCTIKEIINLTMTKNYVLTFFENAEKLKINGNHDISSSDMVDIAIILGDCDSFKLIALLLRFLDPKAIDIADTVFITNTLLELFLKLVKKISSPDVDIELLEIIGDLKNNIIKWCPIKDCIRLTVLNKLLILITDDNMETDVRFDDNYEDSNPLLSNFKSAVVESDKDVHRGQIRKRIKYKNSNIANVLAVQSIMNLLQSIISNSSKSKKELCKFILDLVCPNVNLEAPWPEAASMKYTIERDLNVLNAFEQMPLLWNIFSEALATKAPELVVIVRALFVVLLSFWSSSRAVQCSESPKHVSITVKLLELLSEVEWLPPPLLNISQLIPIISPYEAMTLLFEISNHFKSYAPHMATVPVTKFSPSLKDTVCLIVHNNIENIGVTAFLFSRWGISNGDS